MAYQDSNDFDAIFEDFRRSLLGGMGMGMGVGAPMLGAGQGWEGARMPMVDVLDEGDRFIVTAELPGVRKEDIRVNVRDETVRIHAERSYAETPEGSLGDRAERGLRGQGSRVAGRAGGASVEPGMQGERTSYVRRERVHTVFDRSIRLPEEVRDDQVAARFTNGVLTLTLPKANPETRGGNVRIE